MSLHESLADFAATLIGERVRAVTGSHANLDDFAHPPGDVGLFEFDAAGGGFEETDHGFTDGGFAAAGNTHHHNSVREQR